MSLMEMSFSGTVLILVILTVRAVLKGSLPKRTFAVLWMVALLRLLIPFSVPSAWSAYTFFQNVVPNLENVILQIRPMSSFVSDGNTDPSLAQSGSAYGDADASLGLTADSRQNNQPSAFSANISEEMPSETIPSVTKQTRSNPSIWKMIWAAGFLISLIIFTWIYGRCFREFQMSLPVETGILGNWWETHPLRRKLSIRQSDQIASPISYGVWHPVILLSKSEKWGDRFRLRYVLEHEYVHIQYFDAAVKLVMVAALCVHWFNPFVYLMYVFFNRDLELACDETVVRRLGEDEKAAYAMALIEMEEEKSGLLFLGNSFSKNAIEERIRAIMKIKKITPLARGMSAALVCGITLIFATSCGTYGEAEKALETSLQAETVDVQGIAEKNRAHELEETVEQAREVSQRTAREAQKKAEEAVQKSVTIELEEIIENNVEKAKEADITAGTALHEDTEYTTDHPYHSAAYMISISDEFREYKKFGLSYDKKSDYLMYQNQTVGYFKDETKPNVYTRLAEGSGKLGIIVNRDDSRKITEFTVFPFDESSLSDSYIQEKDDEISAEASSGEATFEEGDPDDTKSSVPREYAKLGVKLSDEKNNLWIYKGKGVAVIYDKDHWFFSNDSIPEKNAVYLEVIRDKKDQVTELKEVTKKEMQDKIGSETLSDTSFTEDR